MLAIPMEGVAVSGDGTDLVARAADGDTAAFEALYRENAGRVYAVCLRMTGDPTTAEELAQEAFIKAWTSLDKFRGDAAFSTWLHRIATNTVLSHRRSEARRRAKVTEQEDLSMHEDTADRTHRGPAVDLEGAIAELPEGARTVFVLFDIEGYRHDQIADRLGIAVGTSKAQLHRARKLLREELKR